MMPGQMVEVLHWPHRVPVEMVNGVAKTKVDGKTTTVQRVWRPAVFAGAANGCYVFRLTDSRAYHSIDPAHLSTCVREPQHGTASQEDYLRAYGELC